MLIDSPEIMRAIFQRCRTRAKVDARGLGELLALASEILGEVDQQGKFLIDVPEDWLPHKWVSAVKADTQRGIERMQAMQVSGNDVLTPENRRQISLLQLLVRELQRLVAIGETFIVYRLGHAFHNVHRELRTLVSDTEYSMVTFRVISADWDMLSMEMREGCCRVVGLELQEGEELINTPGFSINCSGTRQFRIKTLISRSAALAQQDEDVHVVGTVREVHNAYAFVLEDETSSIGVEVSGEGAGELVASYEGKRVAIHGAAVDVLSHELTNRPLVRLKVHAGRIGLVTDSATA